MSRVIFARNVNDALGSALNALMLTGQSNPSRNGQVLAFPYPVMTEYSTPTERVLFSPKRRANPVFHLMESLWMLAGRADVKFPSEFVKNFGQFSDNGQDFWGAYGRRWRSWFGWDQIRAAINELSSNPQSRRVVVSMWDPVHSVVGGPQGDFETALEGGLDVPCNTQIYFDARDRRLNMTVTNRSNDIVWGCYGANAVHMSMLQEYVAAATGWPVGRYTQFSNNLHLYTDKYPVEEMNHLSDDCFAHNYYATNQVSATPLVAVGENIEMFDEDLRRFFQAYDAASLHEALDDTFYSTKFFRATVVPMGWSWHNRKNPATALDFLSDMPPHSDWKRAMEIWLRRIEA